MKNKKGFTLLELLVVVLIIGILTAIALPQYRKVKEKAEASELLTNVKVLHEAQQRYYLVNGAFAESFDDLDISFGGFERGGCSLFSSFNNFDCISNDKIAIFISNSKHSFSLKKTGKYIRSGFVIFKSTFQNVPANKVICYDYMQNKFCSDIFKCQLLQGDTVNFYYSCKF